jgi:predicted PurR-regulated permease PerM
MSTTHRTTPMSKPNPSATRALERGAAAAGGPPGQSFGWRVFEVAAIAISVLVIAATLWLALDVLLMLFGSVLLATALRAPTVALCRLPGMSERLALFLVMVGVLALFGTVGWLLAPQVSNQVPQLIESLSAAILDLATRFGFERWAEETAENFDVTGLLPSTAGLVGGATGIIASTFGAIANFVILFVIGLYLAANPSLYVEGTTRLVPQHKRARVRETLHVMGVTLRWWLFGQLISMSAVGALTYIGLSLLGVPLAVVLAVIAFLLSFIPFIGAILAGFPVVLVALSQGMETGLWALALYTLIQSFEGYVLTPMVQRHSVNLAPALTIAAQILLGVLVGAIGIALATPVAAAGLVAVKLLYVEDVLGEETDAEDVLERHHHEPASS